ncbi:hypothetical protein ACFQE8_09045 [Salinirubellus sp. GCM10025818]|jgi:hypothetical protein|uniref:hypothetical protein n=1 Tax=Salinirubellus TaxID=2162630 RepID=UPI0030D2EA24
MRLDRWTPLAVLWPERYVSRDLDLWSAFDIEEWSRRGYDWVEDDWNGFLDLAKRPHETLADGTGDCEDYALVAASWALANDRPGVGLAVCWEWPYPWPRHAIAYDDERVYSSGRITRESVAEYTNRDGYLFSLRRPLRREAGDRVSGGADESDPV